MAFYTHGGVPAQGSTGASAEIRAELDSIAASFVLLGALTADRAIVNNSGGTARTVTAGTLALPYNFAIAGAAITLTATGTTNVTLPTSGTLLATNGSAADLTSFPTLNQNTTGSSASCTGNAATVTTNANLSGDVSSSGNTTTIGSLKVTNGMIANTTIDLAAKVTGVLPTANGGTGIAYFTAAGPTAARVYTFPDAAMSVGYLNIPQNSQSAAYELILTDSGKHILHPAADTTARIWTIPANGSVAFPVGTAITFVNETLGGVITISITSDTLLFTDGTTGSRSLAASSIATALKITTTKWIISGSAGLT
ncbi:MAG: hypothetical protein Q7R68_11000 [Nitrospirales bacterium]|nr:hypothetical protein [Nitrospirales bacterium]